MKRNPPYLLLESGVGGAVWTPLACGNGFVTVGVLLPLDFGLELLMRE